MSQPYDIIPKALWQQKGWLIMQGDITGKKLELYANSGNMYLNFSGSHQLCKKVPIILSTHVN
jgi:hypothetical protein